jgi:hypothetical protein
MQSPLSLVELANMMLGVEFKAELGDEVDLGFKEIDMMFLVVHQLLEEAARHIVLDTVAVGSPNCPTGGNAASIDSLR